MRLDCLILTIAILVLLEYLPAFRQSIRKPAGGVKRNVLPHKTLDFIGDIFGYGKDISPVLYVTITGDSQGTGHLLCWLCR